MEDRFEVTVSAGTMMAGSGAAARFPHRWTPGGVTVEAEFTGGICFIWPQPAVSSMTCTGKPRRWESNWQEPA